MDITTLSFLTETFGSSQQKVRVNRMNHIFRIKFLSGGQSIINAIFDVNSKLY